MANSADITHDRSVHSRRPEPTLAEIAAMNVEQWRAALRSALGSTDDDDPSDAA
jgi:hypothetical protein